MTLIKCKECGKEISDNEKNFNTIRCNLLKL